MTDNSTQATDANQGGEARQGWPVGEFGLSLEFCEGAARSIDWAEAAGDDCEGWRVILPPITPDIVDEYAPATLAYWIEENGEPERGGEAPDGLREEFEGTQEFDEWRASFDPVMSYVWPVSLSYGHAGTEEAARLISEFAPACSLIEFSEEMGALIWGDGSDAPEYGIALSGGGMDLSDELALAYMACGCVPPYRLLSGLHQIGESAREALERSGAPIRQAYAKAASHARHKADNLDREAARLFGEPQPQPLADAARKALAVLAYGVALNGGPEVDSIWREPAQMLARALGDTGANVWPEEEAGA